MASDNVVPMFRSHFVLAEVVWQTEKPRRSWCIAKPLSYIGPMSNEQWIPIGCCCEQEPIDVGGINPWDFEWQSLRQRVQLYHPAHIREQAILSLYQILLEDRTVVFAAGELSAGVWGFFLQTQLISN